MDEEKKNIDDGKPSAAVTRREWLLSLGGAVLLAGYSGAPGDGSAQVAASAAGTLPPGLYLPSLDHLTHVLSNDHPFHPIPPGAETEYLRPRVGPFVPQAFTGDEFPVIRRLVEIILGEDLKNSEDAPVPGAPATIFDEVAEWIDLVVASAPAVRALALKLPQDQRALAVAHFGSEDPVLELEKSDPDRVCHEGLAWLGEESHRRFAKNFFDLVPAQHIELVTSISDARADQTPPNAATRFYDLLKAESIRGFYTSRIGLKELDFKGNAFYSESPGCGLTPLPRITESRIENLPATNPLVAGDE